MKKLILGIVAVFSLQIAFVALTTSDNAREVAVRHLVGESDPDPLFGMIENDKPAPDLSTPIFADTIAERTGVKVRRMTAVHRFRQTAARPKALLASRSTERSRPLDERQLDAIDTIAAKEKPRTVGKSFIAKATPIVQKPYDWLKSIASKLR